MSDLDGIVSVQITVQDKAVTKASFGMPIICDYHTAWVDYVRDYAEADEMLDDGFTTDDALYRMAQVVKQQDPAPPFFKVGRLATPYTQTVQLFPRSATAGFEYELSVAGSTIERTVPSSSSVAAEATALELLVEAAPGIASTADSTSITAVSAPGKLNSYAWQRGIDVIDLTADPGIAADLALIADEDDSWYGMALAPNSDAIVKAAAGWLEGKHRELVVMSGDWDVADPGQTTDLASDLKLLGYNRTGLIWHRYIGGGEWANAAWLAVMLAADPGSATPAFKSLPGVSADILRTGEITAIEAKNASWYAPKHGQNITFEGKAPSGRFLDTTRFVDWLEETIQVDVFSLLINNPKVPFTQAGLDSIGLKIEGALVKGGVAGGVDLASPYSVTVPVLSETDPNDRALRRARVFKFRCRLTGALHGVVVEGTVSV
jgi:Protein of unknown function (DUF3383)